jgi:hypothetical protein
MESIPGFMPPDIGAFEIIHSRPLQPPVGQEKSTGLDQVDPDPQTGPQPHQAAGILGDIGLIQRQAHHKPPIFTPLWIKSRQDKAFSASSCRKTLENRLSILPRENGLAHRGTAGPARHRVITPPRLFVAIVRTFLSVIGR